MGNVLLIILDGIGDRAVEELNNKTPLQYATTRNLDEFAARGVTGIMDAVAPGVRVGSDTAHLALLGYNPYQVYTGRGPFEAAGVGLELKPQDVAFRCNFATVNNKLKVIDRRAGRIKEGTDKLAKAIDHTEIEGVKVLCKEGTEHRCVLVLRGSELSAKVSDIDPHGYAEINWAKPLVKEAEKTARVLNKIVKKSYNIFKAHAVNVAREKPANILLPRGAGKPPELHKLSNIYGIKFAFIAGVSLIKGICKLTGMHEIKVEGATGGVDTDLNAKLTHAIHACQEYDFVFVNIKAPDIYGHDGNVEGKVKIIEKIDRALSLLKDIRCVQIITSDHSTPVSVRDHSGEPVPIAIVGKGVRVDEVKRFDEISCAKGGLGRIRGKDLIPIALNLANRAEKFGA